MIYESTAVDMACSRKDSTSQLDRVSYLGTIDQGFK